MKFIWWNIFFKFLNFIIGKIWNWSNWPYFLRHFWWLFFTSWSFKFKYIIYQSFLNFIYWSISTNNFRNIVIFIKWDFIILILKILLFRPNFQNIIKQLIFLFNFNFFLIWLFSILSTSSLFRISFFIFFE